MASEEGRGAGAREGRRASVQRPAEAPTPALQRGVLQAVNRVLQRALACRSMGELGEVCLSEVLSQTGSECGLIGELTSRGSLDVVAIRGAPLCAAEGGTTRGALPSDVSPAGICAEVLRDRDGLRSSDRKGDIQDVGLPGRFPPVRSWMGVPLVSGSVMGLVVVANRPRGYTERDLGLLSAIAPGLAICLLQKRAEIRVRDSAQRLSRTQELAHLGSWELDLRRDRLTWSDEVYRILGLPPQSTPATYDDFLRHVHPEDREAVDEAFRRSLEEGRDGYEITHRVVQPGDGEVRVVHEKCEHLRDGRGRIVRSVGMAHDITERHHLEQERERYLAAVEEANEAKDLFFDTLSHELRTPLSAVHNALSVLKAPGASERQRRQALVLLERSVGHQSRLIDDLLDVSRVMRGKLSLHREVLDLCSVISHQLEVFAVTARRERLHLTCDAVDAPLWVYGDAVRLGSILSNLIGNAVKFTDPGDRVTISARGEGGEAVVRVEDTGIGIDPGQIPRLFERFEQGEPRGGGSRRRVAGLGLGLALARSLAERHGGALEGFSDGPGQGAAFELRLPLHAARRAESTRIPSPGGRAGDTAGSATAGRPRRVLVVDDVDDLRESMELVLEMLGHTVTTAGTGADALASVARERPHVAFIDIGLPDMDGYEVARRLRTEHPSSSMRLVAVTGYASSGHEQQALEAGFDAFVIKPLDLDDVEQAVAAAGVAPGQHGS